MMTTEISKTAQATTVQVAGRLDAATAPLLENTLCSEIENAQNLILDLKDLTYISSAGLRVLLSAQKKMQKIGTMTVKNVCHEVMEILEITGFADILVIE